MCKSRTRGARKNLWQREAFVVERQMGVTTGGFLALVGVGEAGS
jgi:hypothetical protein